MAIQKKGLEFHIENQDLFGTMATRLELLRHNLNPFTQKRERGILKRQVEELNYLQKKYKIVKL